MKNKLIISLLALLAFTITVKTQDENKVETVKEKSSNEEKITANTYETMLAKLKKGETSIDYVKFRLAYTETKNYSPYGGSEERKIMFKSLNSKKYKKAVKEANQMLKVNYCELQAQYVAYIANRELGNTKEADFHKTVFKGLVSAITENDGLSSKNGMISISISEQYFVMNLFGFERKSKSLLRENGSIFDVHTAYNGETKETREFYFNIDKVFGRF